MTPEYEPFRLEDLQFATGEAAAAKSLQLCPTLWDPIDGSPPGSPIPGILQARTLKWVAISFSNAWKWKVKVKSLSHIRLNPMDCNLPGSSVHGQARVLEWGAIAFSILEKSRVQLLIAPERMKLLDQSENDTQLWMCLVVKVKFDTVKNNIA